MGVNHFEILGIKPNPCVDKSTLKRALIAKQKEVHPDLGDISELSQEVNASYELLKNKEGAVKCFLQLYIDESVLNHNSLPNYFLMEMMDLSELIDESKAENNPILMQEANENLSSLSETLEDEYQKFSTISENPDADELNSLVLWYQKFRYYSRLRKNFEGIEEI